MLGMAALKECPVIMWFSSVKSPINCESHWFILAFVSSLPDLKLKTGLLGWNEPSLCANTLSLFMALTGQHKFFFNSIKVNDFTLKPSCFAIL